MKLTIIAKIRKTRTRFLQPIYSAGMLCSDHFTIEDDYGSCILYLALLRVSFTAQARENLLFLRKRFAR